MAYPASTQTLDKWVEQVDQSAVSLKSAAQRLKTKATAGEMNMDMVRRFHDELIDAHITFTAAAAVDGIAAYVKTQKGDDELNPVTEFSAMLTAVEDTVDWIRGNAPNGQFAGGTFYLAFALGDDYASSSTLLTFSTVQAAPFVLKLNDLIGTIG